MARYSNDVKGLTAWSLEAYKNLTILASQQEDPQVIQIINEMLADAPEFFAPTAREYTRQRISTVFRDHFGLGK